jgi:CheY-like chemotaxis protein
MAKILIVDDDYSIRTLYQFVFMEGGHESVLAKDGQDALGKIETFTPDLMLIDISMPVMDGMEFLRQLKKLSISRPELGSIPFIVLTGENFSKADSSYSFSKNSCCKAFLPKMTQQAQVLALAEKTLKEHGKM